MFKFVVTFTKEKMLLILYTFLFYIYRFIFQKTLELLQSYEVPLSSKIFQMLTELPDRWETLKKIAAQVKHVVQPLMTRQIELLKKRLSYYDFKQQRFKEEFHKEDVFK